MEQARWYSSPEYQAILPIRQRNSTCQFLTLSKAHELLTEPPA